MLVFGDSFNFKDQFNQFKDQLLFSMVAWYFVSLIKVVLLIN